MQKLVFLLCLFSCWSQAQSTHDSPVVFDTPFYEAADHWVLFNLSDENTYALGFLYIDRMAGFTFDYEAEVLLKEGRLVNPGAGEPKEHSLKTRLQRNTMPVHILTQAQLEELDLQTPEWLQYYKGSSETDGYKIDIASFYNSVGGNAIALGILKDIYTDQTTDEKLLFELPYAYNALGRHPEALDVLETALQVNDAEELFYKEKLYAHGLLAEFDALKPGYDSYLKNATTSRYRSEIVYNMVYTHFLAKNREGFDVWDKELRSLEEDDHFFIKNLDMMHQYWDEPRE